MKDITIADMEFLSKVYNNLLESGVVLAVVDFEEFVEAAMTGDKFNFEGVEV